MRTLQRNRAKFRRRPCLTVRIAINLTQDVIFDLSREASVDIDQTAVLQLNQDMEQIPKADYSICQTGQNTETTERRISSYGRALRIISHSPQTHHQKVHAMSLKTTSTHTHNLPTPILGERMGFLSLSTSCLRMDK